VEKQTLNSGDWIRIGFSFGIGFGLAALIFAAVGALAAYVYAHHQTAPTATQAAQAGPTGQAGQAADQTHPAPPSIPTAQQAAPGASHKGQRLVQIPPRDGKTCLQEAHGIIDEHYEACLKGSEYWTDNAESQAPKADNVRAMLQARNDWVVQLNSAVVQAWTVPPGTSPDLKVITTVSLSPNGEVQSAIIDASSGIKAFDDSLLEAINKASPLPLPGNQEAFMPNISLCFSPDSRNCQ
jgi:TonB family protein